MQGPRVTSDDIKQSEHRDIAHPITLECREYIQRAVLKAYEDETSRLGIVPESAPRVLPKAVVAEKPAEEKTSVRKSQSTDDSGDIKL